MRRSEKILWHVIAVLFAILIFVTAGYSDTTIMVAKKKGGETGFVWSNYLEAWYKFETASVGYDSSARGNNLVISAARSSTHYVEGEYSLMRDAVDDSVVKSDADLAAGFPGKASTGYQNFLVSGWLWQNTAPSDGSFHDIIGKYCASGSQRSWKATVWYTSGQAPHFKVQMSSNGSTADISKEFTSDDGSGWPDTMEAGRWYFFAIWHDQALDKWGAYVYDLSTTTGSTFYSAAHSAGVNIGSGSTAGLGIGQFICADSTAGQLTEGWIDHVVIYAWPDNVNPTESEIKTRIAALRDLTAP